MPAGQGPRDNTFQIALEAIQCDVAHLNIEAFSPGVVCLAESDIAAERCLDGEARTIPDMVFDEVFELFVDGGPDLQRYSLVGAVIQLGAAVIGIEEIYTEAVDGERDSPPASGTPATTIICGRISRRNRVLRPDACRRASAPV